MDKNYFLKTVLTALLMTVSMAATAAVVTVDDARQAATTFLRGSGPSYAAGSPISLTLAYKAVSTRGMDDYFVFNIDGGGYVVAAADDRVMPVWGYSTSGTFSAEHLPASIRWWLAQYQEQMEYLRRHPEAKPRRAVTLATSQAPLLTTKWDQGNPYNNFCPVVNNGGSGGLAFTGCAATAMAQVMNYHQWPTKGFGGNSYTCNVAGGNTVTLTSDFSQHTYDWANMKNMYRYTQSGDVDTRDSENDTWTRATSQQQTAVAQLMRDAGIALGMNYGNVESGSNENEICQVLRLYFGYDNNLRKVSRNKYEGDWDAMLRSELDARRPVIYSGHVSGGGGHAFVFDGYDTRGYFHVNWGWSGDGDGYFASTLLSPANQGVGSYEGGYNYNQMANIGIKPRTSNAGNVKLMSDVKPVNAVMPSSNVQATATFKALGGNYSGDILLAVISGSDDNLSEVASTKVGLNLADNQEQKVTFTVSFDGAPCEKYRLWLANPYLMNEGKNKWGEEASFTTSGLTLSKYNLLLKVGKPMQLTATALTGVSSQAVTWRSTNPEVATVDQSGMVKPLKPGITYIVAESGGFSSTCYAEVERPMGDLDGDGLSDVSDINLLINAMLGKGNLDDDAYSYLGLGQNDNCDVDNINTIINGMLGYPVIEDRYKVNGVTFSMVKVDGGTFTMGATAEQGSDAYDWEKPAHQVTLSPYSIGATEVTQALWQAVMGRNPSAFTGNLQRPVEQVTWNDCQTFIARLNSLTGQHFRLPTEAEWEYAARGGANSQGYKYAGSNTLDDVAWHHDNSGSTTHPVSTKAPNELALYDMSGNVWEWCQDAYSEYSSGAQTDPKGPVTGTDRVYRGGGWGSYANYCRVSHRSHWSPDNQESYLGLRLVASENNEMPATALTVSPSSLNLSTGGTQQLTATLEPLNATDGVLWNTSDPSVATVDQHGMVTAKGVGTALITATSARNTALRASVVVTVKPSSEGEIVIERKYWVKSLSHMMWGLNSENYAYQSFCLAFDNNQLLCINYLNAYYWNDSWDDSRCGVYIIDFDCNYENCSVTSSPHKEWYIQPRIMDKWITEKIVIEKNGRVSYYSDGKYMGEETFEELNLDGSTNVKIQLCPYGWWTPHYHYMDDFKITTPATTISDNFNDGVIDLNIWQQPANPSGVREEDGIMKTEQISTDVDFNLFSKPIPLGW